MLNMSIMKDIKILKDKLESEIEKSNFTKLSNHSIVNISQELDKLIIEHMTLENIISIKKVK